MTALDGAPNPAQPVRVYWRPGCMFCATLVRSLLRAGLEPEMRNIWEDDDAAAFVRANAGGNETVPTVSVGDRILVNPPADVVLELAGVERPPRRSLKDRLLGRH